MDTDSGRVARAARIQRVVDGMASEYRGADPQRVRGLLVERLLDAGIATGAQKWLTDTASDICAGRRLVVDARHGRPLVGPVMVPHPRAAPLRRLPAAPQAPVGVDPASAPDRLVLVVLVGAALVALALGWRPRRR